MKLVEANQSEPASAHDNGLHINIPEFVAIIINLWLSIWFIQEDKHKPGGHVLLLHSDNTLLSTVILFATLHTLLMHFFIFSGIFDYTQLNSNRIQGIRNNEADACSRPEKFPSLDSAINQFSQLRTCQPFRLPYGLLSMIATIISSRRIEDMFEQ
jgi:hypothetical protein